MAAPDDPQLDPAENEPILRSALQALRDPDAATRDAALKKLEALYLSCEAGSCQANAAIAHAVLPHVRDALEDPAPEVRIAGARAAQLFASDADALVPQLDRTLDDPVTEVRTAALEALCELGPAAAPSATRIAERALRGHTPEERATAVDALGNAGVQADHLDVLTQALLGDVPAVQACAAHALAAALQSEHEFVRQRVSQALRQLSRAK